jgi:hypothetical protein
VLSKRSSTTAPRFRRSFADRDEHRRAVRVSGGAADTSGVLAEVAAPDVRLREHRRTLTGEVFVVPQERADVVGLVREVADLAVGVDCRLHDIAVMPVPRLDNVTPPRVSSA